MMSEIVAYHLRNKEEITIYDPTSGFGNDMVCLHELQKLLRYE